ncbi:DUF4145 domain-containing protein, partial [Faecalibaculum rodentium]
MWNFDYLKQEPAYRGFTDPAIAAEKVYFIDPSSSLINIRKAVEQGLRFIYRQEDIPTGEKDNLISLLRNRELGSILPDGMIYDLDIIRMLGNQAVHTDKTVEKKRVLQAFLALFEFLDWIAYSYSRADNDVWDPDRRFNVDLLIQSPGSVSRTREPVKTEAKS